MRVRVARGGARQIWMLGLVAAILAPWPAAQAENRLPDSMQLAQAADPKADLDFWNSIKDSKSADDYQRYLDKFPNGAFAELAKLRIKQYAPPQAPAQAAPQQPPEDPAIVEIHDWNAIKDSKQPGDYEDFLKKHPNGNFAELAKLRLKALAPPAKAEATPTATPAPAAPAPAAPALATAPAASAIVFDDASVKLYAKGSVHVRAAPDTVSAVLATLERNTEVNATGKSRDGAWWRVATAGGTGYMAASTLADRPAVVAPAPKPAAKSKAAAPAAPIGPDEDVCKLGSAAAPNDRVSACERLVTKAGSDDKAKLAALEDLAAALTVAHRYDESIRKYEQAAALAPRDATIYYRLGLVRLQQIRFPEARAAFDKAAMLDSRNPDYVFERGVAAAGFGDFEKARNEVHRALLSKDTMQYYEKLGEYELALGNLDAVKTAVERGRKAEPQATSLTLAALDYFLGHFDLAASEAAVAINSDDSPYAALWQALALKAKGDTAGADQALESGLSAVGKDWPAPVFEHLLGKISEDKMTVAAKTSDPIELARRICVAKFYAGEWSFLAGDNTAARASLQDATGSQAFYRLEFAAARGRLAHMIK